MAAADGSKPRDLSQLSGLDVQSAAWTRDGRVVFVAAAWPQQLKCIRARVRRLHSTALIVEGILVAGGVLLLVRRWNVSPARRDHALRVLTFFCLAMAVQTDLYLYAIAGLATGLCVDIAVRIALANGFAAASSITRSASASCLHSPRCF